jgi:Vitamin B12 dependent methionine synthase, activation domain
MRTIDPPGGSSSIRVLDPLPIVVSRPLVMLRLGYRSASQAPPKTTKLLDEVIAHAEKLLAPRAVCALCDVAPSSEGVLRIGPAIGGPAIESNSRSLGERLSGCRTALVFAATIGAGSEDWVHSIGDKGELSKALLGDAYASAAAIALGMALEQEAAREFKVLGLQPTRRHAPGYGDWSLEDQAPLLKLVDAARIGIQLTEDHLMVPAKSISGVIGGRPPGVAPDKNEEVGGGGEI